MRGILLVVCAILAGQIAPAAGEALLADLVARCGDRSLAVREQAILEIIDELAQRQSPGADRDRTEPRP
ncbi:MAG: hypothetical protein ACYSU7_11380 [Planctomycetota bacterium]|jgi:hypothetical protein